MSTRPHLGNVTLAAVTSVALPATIASLQRCLEQACFAQTILFSDRDPGGLRGSAIDWRPIPRLASRNEYSQFILNGLADHIQTSHMLLVQWDGWVRDGQAWRDEFLQFDYIGAPWTQYCDGMDVGNGGFSLRSCKLLQATRHLPLSDEPEDVMICRTYRRKLENSYGIRFAGVDVAQQFSYERGSSIGGEFGFHGIFNLPAELSADALMTLVSTLEPGEIGARESIELLLRAMKAGDWPLARIAWLHHRAHDRKARRLMQMMGWLMRGHDGWPGRNSKRIQPR